MKREGRQQPGLGAGTTSKGGGGTKNRAARRTFARVGRKVPGALDPFHGATGLAFAIVNVATIVLASLHVAGITFVIVLLVALLLELFVTVAVAARAVDDKETAEADREHARSQLDAAKAGQRKAATALAAAGKLDLKVAKTLHHIHHYLRYCAFSIRTRGGEGLDGYLREVVDGISRLFGLLTGSDCRACIRELGVREEDKPEGEWTSPQVMGKVLHRMLKRSGTGPLPPYDHDWRPITGSTVLESIWRGHPERWYLVNDIEEAYRDDPNFRITTRPEGTPKPTYNATINWPIQVDPSREGADHPNNIKFYGVLSVDSLQTGIFTECLAHIGAAIADTCYAALRIPTPGVPTHPAKVIKD